MRMGFVGYVWAATQVAIAIKAMPQLAVSENVRTGRILSPRLYCANHRGMVSVWHTRKPVSQEDQHDNHHCKRRRSAARTARGAGVDNRAGRIRHDFGAHR
jgi:hypothetical protein